MARAKRRMDYYTKMRYQAFGIIGAGVLAIGALVAYSIYEDNQWQAFAAANDCKVISHTAEQIGYGWVNGKMGTMIIPETNTYHCNDGVNYTR